jgi:acyl-ACP thioesterase
MALMYYERNYFVQTRDCDQYDNFKPSSVLDYFSDIASYHADMIGVGYKATLEMGLYWVVLFQEFEIMDNSVKPNDEIIISTWPSAHYKLEYERDFLITDINKKPIIKGRSNWVLIDVEKRMIKRANPNFNGEMMDYRNYEEKSKRKLDLSSDVYIKEEDYVVRKTDLDHNLHMNNARYLDVVFNMVDFKAKKVEIAFIKEARLGDTINVKYYKNENNHSFIGLIEGTKCFECVIKE